MMYKVTVANLGDLRAELRFTQDEMADAMDIVRQSVASMEKGQAFDCRFVVDAFHNLKQKVGEKFAEFDLLEVEGDRERLRIGYAMKKVLAPQPKAELSGLAWPSVGGQELDAEAYFIMMLSTRIRAHYKARDGYINKYNIELEDLKDALANALG